MKKNLLQKVLALLIGLLIWINFALFREYTLERLADITIKNIPENFVITDISHAKIPFIITARGIDFVLISLSELWYTVDASNFVYKDNRLIIDSKHLNIDKKRQIDYISPNIDEHFTLFLDRVVTTQKEIVLNFEDEKTSELFTLSGGKFSPPFASASGAEMFVSKLEKAETEPITKQDIDDGFAKLKAVENVIVNPIKIELSIARSQDETRIISFIAIEHPQKITLIPQKVSIKVKGDSELLQNLTSSRIRAFIDTEKLEEDDAISPIDIELPEGVTLIEKTPTQVQILRDE